MIDLLILGLTALLLGLAAWTVVARESFTAVVSFIAYGLLLTLAWVYLRGIDVALTEAAIGAGLTGALLINAAARLRRTETAARAERPAAPSRWLAAGVSVGRPSGSSSGSTFSGSAPTTPEASSRVRRSWRQCGYWS